MTKEKFAALKSKATEKAIFYSGMGFTNLANDFTEFVNFFNEIEGAVRFDEKEVIEHEDMA